MQIYRTGSGHAWFCKIFKNTLKNFEFSACECFYDSFYKTNLF